MKNLRLILVAPKYSGNVGACARVAANFEIDDILIVTPQCDIRDTQAQLYATGFSKETLNQMREVGTLKEALADCSAAVGFTRRLGHMSPEVIEFQQLPAWIEPRTVASKVALVFGREDVGLLFNEVMSCTHVCTLPTSEKMPSMNLSHATAVVLSQIYTKQGEKNLSHLKKIAAPLKDFEYLIEHLADVMKDAGIYEAGNPDRALERARRALQRAEMDEHEVALFRALLSKIQVALGTRVRQDGNSKRHVKGRT